MDKHLLMLSIEENFELADSDVRFIEQCSFLRINNE